MKSQSIAETALEIQREYILQEDISGSELTIHGKLVNVVHGKYTPDGPPATLVTMQFEFVGSEPHMMRFRKASIVVSFANNVKDELGSLDDPEIVAIAPYGGFVLNSSTEEKRTKLRITGNLGMPDGITSAMGFEFGSGWERNRSAMREEQTTVYGSMRIDGRDLGLPNTAKWAISENKIQKFGIPAVLRVAILVLPRTSSGRFRAIFDVKASVNVLYSTRRRLRKFLRRSVIEPVHFSRDREPMGPEIVGLDPENMSAYATKMKDLGSIKESEVLP